MVDLLEQIRTVLDELTPLLHGRVVDVEMHVQLRQRRPALPEERSPHR